MSGQLHIRAGQLPGKKHPLLLLSGMLGRKQNRSADVESIIYMWPLLGIELKYQRDNLAVPVCSTGIHPYDEGHPDARVSMNMTNQMVAPR